MCASKHVGLHRQHGHGHASSRVGARVNDGRNAGTVVDAAGVGRPCPSTARAGGCAHTDRLRLALLCSA